LLKIHFYWYSVFFVVKSTSSVFIIIWFYNSFTDGHLCITNKELRYHPKILTNEAMPISSVFTIFFHSAYVLLGEVKTSAVSEKKISGLKFIFIGILCLSWWSQHLQFLLLFDFIIVLPMDIYVSRIKSEDTIILFITVHIPIYHYR
jgi:hypothetical protein